MKNKVKMYLYIANCKAASKVFTPYPLPQKTKNITCLKIKHMTTCSKNKKKLKKNIIKLLSQVLTSLPPYPPPPSNKEFLNCRNPR